MYDFIREHGIATCTSSRECAPGDPADFSRTCSGCDTGCAPFTGGWTMNGTACSASVSYKGNCNVPYCSSFARCIPYTFSRDVEPLCLDTPRAWPIYGPSASESTIQAHITQFGTMSAVIRVFDGFDNFWDYNPKRVMKATDPQTGTPGGHAIVIIGWGTSTDNTPYWKVKNCWGSAWGDNGFFYLERGENVLGIEERVCSSPPAEGDDGTKLGSRSNSSNTIRNSSNTIRNSSDTIRYRNRLLPGGWVNADLEAEITTNVAKHIAKQHNHVVVKIRLAKKQVVAGWNHYVEFDAVSDNGLMFQHKTTTWTKPNGEMTIVKHVVTQV